MADDKVLKDEDDEIDIIEVAELPAPGAEPKKAAPEADDEEHEDESQDDEEQEDARLADQDEDEEAEPTTEAEKASRKKRVKRRQIQKLARDRTLQELSELRQFKLTAEARFNALETNNLTVSEGQVDQRLSEVRRDIETADAIIAKALTAGNGDDFVAAQRIRDEAKAAEQDLLKTKNLFGEARKPKDNTPDPTIATFANAWKAANPWYDSRGLDEDSAIVNVIDKRLTDEGFDPKSGAYWSELTKRVKARLHPGDEKPVTTRKKPPPQGANREHVPAGTRREVYVTPERKAAMIEAGIWDDPQRRTKMLKAYADFDRDNRSAG